MKIANDIYGYSKGAAMGKFKHPCKGAKMDRTTEDVATTIPPKITEHCNNIHLDIDLVFVTRYCSFWQKSRNIGFIHCKALLSKYDKRVQNGLKSIVLD